GAIRQVVIGVLRWAQILRGERVSEGPDRAWTGKPVVPPWHPGIYLVYEAMASFLFGIHETAVEASARATEAMGSFGHIVATDAHFYAALALAAEYDRVSPGKQAEYPAALIAHQAQ